ncbi:MAG: hypothetical protein ACJAW7_002431 [Candidatus Azotimanducaceae bacterium]|jgi:hypothetical protein
MATEGLKGIWGFEQLDKTGIATWKLGLILMGTTPVVSYILMKLLSEIEPNPVYGPISPEALITQAFGWVFGPTGAVVGSLALARSLEKDLKALALVDNVIDASIERLRPTRTLCFTCMAIGLLCGSLLSPILYSHGPRLNLTVLESVIAIASGGPDLIMSFIIVPISGLALGLSWAIIISQINSLAHAARHIKIDFLQLNDYAAIANAGVRLFLAVIAWLSINTLMMLFVDEPTTTVSMMRLSLVFGFVAAVMLLPYIYPVWILRNRIKDKKIAEMAQNTRSLQSLRGDDEVMSTISSQGRGASTTTADLLTYRMFLDSLWEWPIASHVQKLILFGLLPPLTWVVAAMIENAMY